jgi:hypothetical protein
METPPRFCITLTDIVAGRCRIFRMDTTVELRDKDEFPDEGVLQAVFGKGYPAYLALLEILREHEIDHEWRYYNDGKAWLCKATRKKKTIVWMSARRGFIMATIYFPAAHIEGIYGLDMAQVTKDRIRETKNTGKSKGCTFEVKSKAVLKDFTAVLRYKLAIA